MSNNAFILVLSETNSFLIYSSLFYSLVTTKVQSSLITHSESRTVGMRMPIHNAVLTTTPIGSCPALRFRRQRVSIFTTILCPKHFSSSVFTRKMQLNRYCCAPYRRAIRGDSVESPSNRPKVTMQRIASCSRSFARVSPMRAGGAYLLWMISRSTKALAKTAPISTIYARSRQAWTTHVATLSNPARSAGSCSCPIRRRMRVLFRTIRSIH